MAIPKERYGFAPIKDIEKDARAQIILMNTVLGYNGIGDLVKDEAIPFDDKSRIRLNTVNEQASSLLLVNVWRPRFLREPDSTEFLLGHFDPSRNKFLSYTELIPDNDFAVIEPHAARMLQRNSRFDYSSGIIQQLHQGQRNVLSQGLVQEILDRRNQMPTENDATLWESKNVHVDDTSSFFVGLSPKVSEYPAGDKNIMLTIQGGFIFHDDQAIRCHPLTIPLGQLSEHHATPNSAFIDDYEFDSILGLVDKIKGWKNLYPSKFDEEYVAFKTSLL